MCNLNFKIALTGGKEGAEAASALLDAVDARLGILSRKLDLRCTVTVFVVDLYPSLSEI